MYENYYLDEINDKLDQLTTITTNQTNIITKLQEINEGQIILSKNLLMIGTILIIGYLAVFIRKLLP